MKNYLRAFSDTLKKIVDSPSDVVVDDTIDNGSPEDEDIAEFTRDLALPIYLYLKMHHLFYSSSFVAFAVAFILSDINL